ncbi:hypothetical protein Scep_005679 [Stephania cephalantha]|uniref:Uncharacterized protein n=1 Tax=Stephania cephalantha TaxID=152367 RepID=A0AAP0KXD6_9MAGN
MFLTFWLPDGKEPSFFPRHQTGLQICENTCHILGIKQANSSLTWYTDNFQFHCKYYLVK